jgi:hypothetical protein
MLGFGIGFIGYSVLPGLTVWFSNVIPNYLSQSMVGALIAGVVGSAISTFTIVCWANRTT